MKNTRRLSDEALVGLVRGNNQELYEHLVKRYQEKLLRYAKGLVGDQDRAADVVQEAFIRAFVNLKGFNTKKKFSSWIYRIVHNQAINHLKKNRKEISLDENQWIKDTFRSKVNIEADYDRQEVKQALRRALKKLSIKYRSPLVLFFLEEKTYGEISDILRIPIGTVGTRINRGKKLLKVIYESKEGK